MNSGKNKELISEEIMYGNDSLKETNKDNEIVFKSLKKSPTGLCDVAQVLK